MQVESKRLTNCSLIFILRLLINNVFPLITTSGAYLMSKPLRGGAYYRVALGKEGDAYFKKKEELFI